MPIDKRTRSSGGGSNQGTITKILSALFGQGGEAESNTPIDAFEAPEFEGSFITPKGQIVGSPFSSRGYNFFDKLSGKTDQAAELNNKVFLDKLLGEQAGIQGIINQRGLNKLALELVEPMGEATTKAEINRRRSLIPVTEEETGSKNRLELRQKENLIPIEGRNTATQTYASRGIFPDDIGQLSALTAQNLATSGENQLTRANLVQRLMNAPENRSLFEGAALAEAAAPIGALRNALETAVPTNTRLERDSIGNPTLDALINPGVYTGNVISQEPAGHIPLNINGQIVNMPIGEKSSVVRPGGFQRRIPINPNITRGALESLNPKLSLSPTSNDFISTDQAPFSKSLIPVAPAQQKSASPVLNETMKNLIGEGGTKGLQKLLEYLLKGGLTETLDPFK